jgi:hypothetical protein
MNLLKRRGVIFDLKLKSFLICGIRECKVKNCNNKKGGIT